MRETEEIFHQKTDYKKIILNLLKYKYYFVFFSVTFLIVSYIMGKYTQPEYSNFATILIAEEQKNSFMNSGDIMSGGFGLFSGIKNVENELSILSSYEVINEVVDRMNLEVSYGIEKDVIPIDIFNYTLDEELYKNSPIQVVFDQTHIQPIWVNFYVQIINDSTYKLECEAEGVSLYNYMIESVVLEIDSLKMNQIHKFGETIQSEFYSFSLHLDKSIRFKLDDGERLFFKLNNLVSLTGSFKGNLSLATKSTTSSVVTISLKGSHRLKITDFLNNLTQIYLEKNLEKKNKKVFSTVQFIDAQISDIADSLSFAENKMQKFRSSNKVMDMSFQGQKLYERMTALEAERAEFIVQQQYYVYIREYFEMNDDVSDMMAPSSYEIKDPLLSKLVGDLLTLNSQRMKYISQENSKNLFMKDLEIQITNLKSTILENIEYNSNRAEILLVEIDSRRTKLNNQIARLPKTERELIGLERQFKLNDEIYTFLLQKRAEAQIARASNAADYEIIEPAYYFRAKLITAQSSMTYIFAIFLGIALPLLVVLIRDFFNNKVTDLAEIENASKFPVIGQVLRNRTKSNVIIRDYPKSPQADSFRAIRTNLQFFSEGAKNMTILVTSSMSGEGKSFCSVNLASVYALLGKKTLLIGFDLRRPALYDDFELENQFGITSYLIRNARIDEIIQKTSIENLDLIAAGPIPPNPVELIASDRTKLLFDELKQKYDYIIIDSAPIGAVTDSLLLFNYADVKMFTVRHNYTQKDALKVNLKSLESKDFGKVAILINDIQMKKNHYGYTYQSNYYGHEKKGFKLSKLAGVKRR